MVHSRYGPWDGREDPLGDRHGTAELLDRLGDDLLSGMSGGRALQELRRRGLSPGGGLDDLRRELAARREALDRELGGDGPLAGLGERLDEIEEIERSALASRADEQARLDELALDALPRDPVGRLRGLQEHEFTSPEAAAALAQLADELRADLLSAQLASLTGALEAVSREDVERVTQMLADLNDLLRARAANGGEPPMGEQERFDAFLQRHGDLLPEAPRDLDELLAALARRARAAQAFLASLDDREREELLRLAREVFDDPDLELELEQLGGNLAGAFPNGLPAGSAAHGGTPGDEASGDGPISAQVTAHQRLAELEELERQLEGGYAGARLEDVDEEALRRHLGEEAVRHLEELREIERTLERDGVLRSNGGELELTPRGARLLGERTLARLTARIRRQPSTRTAGVDPEPTGQTRAYEFGAGEPLATGATVRNAVLRRAAAGTRPRSGPVGLEPDDLEVAEQEVRPRVATALLLDLSFSMPLQGHFVPAKRMALALHALIEGRHRQDSLYLVGFSDYARRLRASDLAAAGFERVYGTNMHHAFLLARRLLAGDRRPIKRAIMVTDGEPTAHLVDGRSVFNWPPVSETLSATLREAMRLGRAGVELDVLLLEDEPGLVAFAERLAQVTDGEVTRIPSGELGDRVLRRYW